MVKSRTKSKRSMSGGNLTKEGSHIFGTSFPNDVSVGFNIAYNNDNDPESSVRVTSTGGLQSQSGEIIATSAQVYKYVNNPYGTTKKFFWFQAVSRLRNLNQSQFVPENGSYPTLFRFATGDIVAVKTTSLDDKGSLRGTSWIYSPEEDIFVREEGAKLDPQEAVLVSFEKIDDILDKEDNYYQVLHLKENAAYAKKVNDEKQTRAQNTKPSSVANALTTVGSLLGAAAAASTLPLNTNNGIEAPPSTDVSKDLTSVPASFVLGALSAASFVGAQLANRSAEQEKSDLENEASEASQENKRAQEELKRVQQNETNPVASVVTNVLEAVIPSAPAEPVQVVQEQTQNENLISGTNGTNPIADVASTVTNALTAVIPSAPAAESAPVKPIQAVSKILNPVTSLLSTTARTVAGLSQPRMNRIQPRLVRTKTPVQVLMDEVLKKKLERERQRSPVQRSPIRRSPYPIVRVRRVRTPRKNKTRSRSLKKKSRSLRVRTPRKKRTSRSRNRKSKSRKH